MTASRTSPVRLVSTPYGEATLSLSVDTSGYVSRCWMRAISGLDAAAVLSPCQAGR